MLQIVSAHTHTSCHQSKLKFRTFLSTAKDSLQSQSFNHISEAFTATTQHQCVMFARKRSKANSAYNNIYCNIEVKRRQEFSVPFVRHGKFSMFQIRSGYSLTCRRLKHQNSLRGHMARHLDAESEHICTECGKRAPSRGALRSHQKYVHNNTQLFACTLCVKSFKKSLTLKEHIASCHTGEVLYHCPYCTKTFNSSANLCSHKKRMHQNNVESVAWCWNWRVFTFCFRLSALQLFDSMK